MATMFWSLKSHKYRVYKDYITLNSSFISKLDS